jgi:ankyrin repeat protein
MNTSPTLLATDTASSPGMHAPSSTTPQPAERRQAPNMYTRLPVSAIPSRHPGTRCNDTPRSTFHAAVHDGDATAVKRMIRAGKGDRNTIDMDSGLTALGLAAQCGHDDVVLILCKGASAEEIHRPSCNLLSPLMLAAAASHTDAMDVLLHKAAAQEYKDEALTWAAAHGQVASMALLLAHGARAEHRDALGATPLHAAAAMGHGAAIDLLLEAGADPDAIDFDGDSAFSLAVRAGRVEAVRRLLQSMAAASGSTGQSALMFAAARGHADAVALLLAAGDDPHAATLTGDTALLLAAAHGQAATVRLLAKKANVQHANRHGDTALILAARGGHFDIVQRLLVKGGARCDVQP